MKKIIKIILIVFAFSFFNATFVFAGGQEDTSIDDTVELVYWSHYGQSPVFVQSFADAANKALLELGYKNVTVKAQVIEYSGYEAKYLTAFASGNGPDIFLGAPADWALNGGANPIALPFPEDLRNKWDKSLAKLYYSDGLFGGDRYGFPAEGGSIQLLYINQGYMKELGLDAATDYPKTFSELRELAIKLTKFDADGNIIRAGYAPRYLGGGGGVAGKFLSIFHQFGARVLSEDLSTAIGYINSQAAKQAFQEYRDMVYIDKSINLEFGAPEAAFQSGQAAIITREGWFAQDTEEKAPNIEFYIAPFIGEKVNVASTQGDSGWCNMINSKSDNIDILTDLFEELTKSEYDIIQHESAGYPPVMAETMTMDNAFFASLPYADATNKSLNKTPAPTYDAISS